MSKLRSISSSLRPLFRSFSERRFFHVHKQSLSSDVTTNEPDSSADQVTKSGGECLPQEPGPTMLTTAETLARAQIDQKVALQGWVRSIRRLKNHYFLSVSDGLSTHHIQVVVPTHLFSQDDKPEFGSSVSCVGTFTKSQGREQTVEVYCDKLNVIGHCKPSKYPFLTTTGKSGQWKVMRTFPHLRPRVPPFASLLRFRHDMHHEIHQLMRKNGYIYVTAPVLTKNECEGGCKSFVVKSPDDTDNESFFDAQVKLTVSSQLHLETAACALSKVYAIGPAFRAENTQSRRHLNEFTMFEMEEAFLEDLDALIDRAEFVMKSLADLWLSEENLNLSHLLSITKYKSLEQLARPYFRVTYDEVVNLLNQRQKIQPIKYGEDLSAYHESVILKYFEDRPTFITHFPMEMKPFYMKSHDDKALCFDLIAPIGGEVCGGSLREDDSDTLKSNMEKKGIKEDLEWYLDLREFGNVPHGGFGFGFDRMIQTFTGLAALKDVVPYARYPHHCNL